MEQTIKITIPADAASPALVEFSPGRLAREAARLAAIPGSGWNRVSIGNAELDKFLVDRRLVAPKPLRKGRPDASDRMKGYNERRKAKAQPQPQPQPPDPTEELLRRRYARRDAEARESHIPIVDPFDPGDF